MEMYVPREIKEKFERIQKAYSVIAVVGARQAGKTTFLKEHKPEKAIYLLFDDPDVRELFDEDIKKFEKQYLEDVNVGILDEVQYCLDAGKKLKYLAEKGKRLWITSSSEILLGKEVLSYLVGRVSIIKLYPFSLPEFLAAKGQKEITPRTLKRGIWEHALYGGYPKVVLTEDIDLKKTILRDLYETMILKDIAKTFSIDDLQSLEQLTRYLAINAGGVLSYEAASKTLKVSFQTIKKYIKAMEKSYLLVRVPPYFRNQNKEISKQPKIYFIDTGLKNIITGTFPAELEGSLFENYVLSELLKLGLPVRYWRTKARAEVDFVIEKDNELIPIEVKLASEKIEASLRSFIETYRPKKAFLVNYQGIAGKRKIGSCVVMITDVRGLIKALKKNT